MALCVALQPDGTLHVWADVNVRQSPTVAAVLSMTMSSTPRVPAMPATATPPVTSLSSIRCRR